VTVCIRSDRLARQEEVDMFDMWPKHFVYLSPPKINALFEQIPTRDLRGIAKKVTVDLKVLKAELGPAANRPDTIYSRLKVVLEHLERKSMIGSVDYPAQYFGVANMPMRWGPYQNLYGSVVDESPLVWFAGETTTTSLGLGGSVNHIAGYGGDAPTHSHSATPILISALHNALDLPPPHFPDHFIPTEAEQSAESELWSVELANSESRGTSQPLEFVAKRLLWGAAALKPSMEHVLLGTPLYVALAN
jgi:hypothetical protein